MSVDLDQAVGYQFKPVTISYEEKDVSLYALSIGAATDPSAQIDSTIYLDLEAGWNVNDNWRVVLGGVNVLDEYIDEIGPPNANRLSVGLQYPRRTVANYEGGSWYLKAIYAFD